MPFLQSLRIVPLQFVKAAMKGRLLRQGPGWRIGKDLDSLTFQGLVGGEDWAIELTLAELGDFCRLLQKLAETMQQMSTTIMDQEHLSCEVEGSLIWMEAEGKPNAYSLRFQILTGRRAEGSWPSEVVPDLLQASQTLGVF